MKNRQSFLLRAFCVWTAFVWIVLIKNMIMDDEHTMGFRVVHITLAVISLGFAAASWPLAKKLKHS